LTEYPVDPLEDKAEVVSNNCEDRIDGIALFVGEVIAVHSMAGFEVPITGSTADFRFIWRFMALVTRCFWPAVKTWNLWLKGALWPLYPASARMRLRVAPVICSISGMMVASVCPSYGLPVAPWQRYESTGQARG